MTAEDWAPYGLGEPDADGWYQDYRPVPERLKPPRVEPHAVTKTDIDWSLTAIVANWRTVVAELLIECGIDLYDDAVRARPWPGVRTAIYALIETPGSRLRTVLTRR